MRRRSLYTFLLLSSSFVSLPIYLSTSIISNLSPIINLPHLSSSLPFYIYHIQPFSYYQPTSSLFLSTFQHLSYPTFLLLCIYTLSSLLFSVSFCILVHTAPVLYHCFGAAQFIWHFLAKVLLHNKHRNMLLSVWGVSFSRTFSL